MKGYALKIKVFDEFDNPIAKYKIPAKKNKLRSVLDELEDKFG